MIVVDNLEKYLNIVTEYHHYNRVSVSEVPHKKKKLVRGTFREFRDCEKSVPDLM